MLVEIIEIVSVVEIMRNMLFAFLKMYLYS